MGSTALPPSMGETRTVYRAAPTQAADLQQIYNGVETLWLSRPPTDEEAAAAAAVVQQTSTATQSWTAAPVTVLPDTFADRQTDSIRKPIWPWLLVAGVGVGGLWLLRRR